MEEDERIVLTVECSACEWGGTLIGWRNHDGDHWMCPECDTEWFQDRPTRAPEDGEV